MFKSKQEDSAIAGLLSKFDDQQDQLTQLRVLQDAQSEYLINVSTTAGASRSSHALRIANLETKLNLLMGFLKIEEYEISEVPPTPGIPARVDMRKVTGR